MTIILINYDLVVRRSALNVFVKSSNSPAKKQRDKKACKFWNHEAYLLYVE